LDALRAAKSYAPFGISANAVMGGYGYSGGAIASGWAAALHSTYAPELNIKGWAFGGTPANVTSTFLNVDGTFFAGFAAAGLAGLTQAYPAAATRLNSILTATGKAAIAKVLTQCAVADLLDFLSVSFLSTSYQSEGAGLLSDSVLAPIFQAGVLASNKTLTPIAPVYMYHGQADEIIPYASAKTAAANWCSYGAQIIFVTETGGTGHLGTENALAAGAISWLNDRINGVSLAAGCSQVSISTSGLSFKRGEGYSNVLERFGVGDSKVIARMLDQHKRGVTVDSFWSYLRD